MGLVPFPGNSQPTLGVELELQLVDERTLALKGAIAEVLAGLPEGLQDSVKPEFLQCYVEITTDVCGTVADVGEDLARKVEGVAEAAGRCGTRLGWGATHPFSHWHDQQTTPSDRYYHLSDLLQETVRRPATYGLHVHVGVGSGDTAVSVMNGLQEFLPALLALSANSPFWCGRATGLHAHRIELLEGFPTGGMAPILGGWEEYLALLGRLAECGFIASDKELWWDVRPNRGHGTVEVRVCDMPADLPAVLGLTALIQCLVDDLSRAPAREETRDPFFPLIMRQNRWRAARFGLGAELVDPGTGKASHVRTLLKRLIGRLTPTAERLGCAGPLAHAAAMAEGPSGAERQLALFQETGDLVEVARFLCGEHSRPPSSAAPFLPASTSESNGHEGGRSDASAPLLSRPLALFG